MKDNVQQHYEAINLESLSGLSEYDFFHLEQKGQKAIRGLSHINLFIGPNNSGKSRLIRELFKAAEYEFDPIGISAARLREEANKLQKMINNIYLGTNKNELISGRDGSQISSNFFHSFLDWPFFVYRDNLELPGTIFESFVSKLEIAAKCKPRVHPERLEILNNAASKLYEELKNFKLLIGNEPKYYIPILRGLRPIRMGPNETENPVDLYRDRTINDYSFSKDEGTHKVFSGQLLYGEVKNRLLGTLNQRRSHANYEKFLGENFFNGLPVSLIPRHHSPEESDYKEKIYYDMVWIKIGEEEERPICALGDGLQTIILMTYLPFVQEERSLFFIEEPDAFLHPGMQRQLLEVLSHHEKFKQHQFFMTTHSNHMLDMTLDYSDISTYLIKVNEKQRKISLVTHDDRVLLAELGARSSSMFLTNASIWVEGVTDRKYIKEFLKKYWCDNNQINKHVPFKEDIHYSFLEFGGSTITHWDYSTDSVSENNQNALIKVRKICGSSFVVLDGDNRGKGSRENNLEKALEFNLHLLDVKEIENTLTASIIQAVVKDMIKSSEKLNDERKANALLKVNKINENNYQKKNLGLGFYLDELLEIDYFASGEKDKKNNKPKTTATINRKIDFCERAIQIMTNNTIKWELTESAKELCEKLSSFINSANPSLKRAHEITTS